jgi:adenosylcobinamide kinase/adenosylcobinamide-phosphate guanylyltransferase
VVKSEIDGLVNCIRQVTASFVVVTNEVGMGVVPESRLGRLYRDSLGRANQMLAGYCDEIYLMVAGIPVRVKPAFG